MRDSVIIELIVDSSGAVTGIRNANGETQRLNRTLTDTEKRGKGFGPTMQMAFGVIAANAVSYLTRQLRQLVSRGFQFLSQGLRDANIQAILDDRLAQALRNAGDESLTSYPRLRSLADEVQRLTNFSNEQVQAAQAMLLSFRETAGPEGVQMLTPRLADAAAGVASFTGQAADLNTIASAVGRALNSGAGALTRYGISLSDAQRAAFETATGLDRVRILTEILDSNFKGMAETTADPFVQLQNATDDLRKTFGQQFLPVVRELASMFRDLAASDDVNDLARQIGQDLAGALEHSAKWLKENIDLLKGFAHEAREGGQAVVYLFQTIGDLEGALDAILRSFSDFEGIAQDANRITFTFSRAIRSVADRINEMSARAIEGAASLQDMRASVAEWLGMDQTAEHARQTAAALRSRAAAIRENIAAQREARREETTPETTGGGTGPGGFTPGETGPGGRPVGADALAQDFRRRELEIMVLPASIERIRRETELEFDKLTADLRKNFPELAETFSRQLAELQERVVQERTDAFWKDLIPEIEVPELNDEALRHSLDDVRALMEVDFLTSVRSVDSVLSDLQEQINTVTTQDARDELTEMITRLHDMRAGMLSTSVSVEDVRRQFETGFLDSLEKVRVAKAALQLEFDRATTEAARREIAAMIGALDDLEEKMEGVSEAGVDLSKIMARELAGAVQDLSRSIIGAFDRAGDRVESFGRMTMRILGNVAQSLSRTFLQLGISTGNPALIGGGLVAGLIGGLFGRSRRSVPGRAAGGPVVRQKPYMVGERGPELFVPAINGQVVNHERTAHLLRMQGLQIDPAILAALAPVVNTNVAVNVDTESLRRQVKLVEDAIIKMPTRFEFKLYGQDLSAALREYERLLRR